MQTLLQQTTRSNELINIAKEIDRCIRKEPGFQYFVEELKRTKAQFMEQADPRGYNSIEAMKYVAGMLDMIDYLLNWLEHQTKLAQKPIVDTRKIEAKLNQ